MKLGIVADEIHRDFGEAVRIGTGLGIHRYEIRHLQTGRFPLCNAQELREVERIASGEGIEITGLSPGLFKLCEGAEAFELEMAGTYPRAAEWAQRWNLPGLIVFGFHKPGATEEDAASLSRGPVPDFVIEWMARAGETAAGDGLQLMIEPEPVCWADCSRAAVDMIGRTGSKALRINYDPGNVAWLEQRDPLDELDAVSRWIANVHVKDLLPLQTGGTRPIFVPAGEGMIDYRAHFSALRRRQYEGPISLEPHMDGRPETIRRCKEAVEALWEQSA